MKRMIAVMLVASLVPLNMIGCSKSDKSSTKQETKITAPGGTTTITTERNVKTTGEKPPAVAP